MRFGPLLPIIVVATLSLLPAAAFAATNSYRDSSTVPLGAALAAPVRTPPSTPPDSDVNACTSEPADPANPALGRVHNRFLWCRRSEFSIFKNDGSGAARMRYTAMGYGRDDGVRAITIFFRPDSVEAIGSRPPSPSQVLAFRLACDDTDPEDVCHPSAEVSGTLLQWDRDAVDGVWSTLTVSSDDPGPLFSGVRNHRWQLTGRSFGPDGPSELRDQPWHNFRCDSATYFRMGGERPKACVFTDVIPHLIYRTSDTRVKQVAEHIRDAQNSPLTTFPEFAAKSIPGKYFVGAGLHRLARDTPEYRDNRAVVAAACEKRGEFAGNGLPNPPGPGQDCDEYPFASTYEGAADDHVNFSVRAVDHGQNCSAGSLLGWYFTTDRILYDWLDEFYVEILDGPPGGGDPTDPPPDVPSGGGEEDVCAVIPPLPSPPRTPAGQLRINDVALTEGDSGAQDAVLTVSMSRPTGETVAVDYATGDGTATAPQDYQARSGRLVFGPDERIKRIVVPVNGDTAAEGDEAFYVRLSNASGGTIVDGEGQVVIRTDPEPSLKIDDVRIEEEDADVTFTASLTEANNTPVGAQFATADVTATAGADYDARSGRIDIPAGGTSAPIAIHVKEDFADEIDEEAFKVVLANVTNAGVADAEGVAVIRDDDRNGLFTCRATAARLGSAAYRVANPALHPCRDDVQPGALLDVGAGGLGVSLRTSATTDQTPNDLTGTKPAVGDRAVSHADATSITIRAGLNLIRLDAFVSDARVECTHPPDAPQLTSSSRVTLLSINGQPVISDSAPLTLPLVLATLRLNQTVRDAHGVVQRALVLDQLLGPDLVLGEAEAGWRGTDVHPNGHPCVV